MIKFGTEGWRGIIGDDFNFNNIKIVSKTICNYVLQVIKENKKIIIGYDTRFLSDKFAEISADIFDKNGFNVLISNSPVTSPNISYSTKFENSNIGIMITASHNPYKFNGLKIKANYGGPIPDWVAKEIEKMIPENLNVKFQENFSAEKKINKYDFKKSYIEYLKLNFDFTNINRLLKNNKIVIDYFYGTTIGYLENILNKKNLIELNCNYDPLFGGLNPEPVVESNLLKLKNTVKKEKALLGIAFDGDGDRVGIIDDKGNYLTPHIVFPLILYFLVEYKKLKGKVVQALSLGYLSERISKEYNLEFEETSVGFKNICEKMLKENVLLGGEESGGYAINSQIPERDGFISGLTLLEMLVFTGKRLSDLVKELQKKFGKSYFIRKDIHLSKLFFDKNEFTKNVVNLLPFKILNDKIKEIRQYDGVKIIFNDDSWLLLRPSGTEPLIRIYSETSDLDKTKKLVDYGEKILKIFQRRKI